MRAERANILWFSSFWGFSRRNRSRTEKIGILAFEVATLMSKVVNLWTCLTDVHIAQLRDDVIKSPGIVKLVSDDENYLMKLAFSEVIENICEVTRFVTRLGKRCSDPMYHQLDQHFRNPLGNSVDLYGWEYGWKKMEKKVKKMERFVAVTSQLHQEMEVLVELEQTLRRMQCSRDIERVKLLDFQQKVIWQRQEVKNLRELSPWSRTYDHTVELLLRCLVTVIGRLKFLIGVDQLMFGDGNNNIFVHQPTAESLSRSSSFVLSSENHASIFYSGRSTSLLGLPTRKQQYRKHLFFKTKLFSHSGPLKECMVGGGGGDSPVIRSCTLINRSGSSSATTAYLSEGGILDASCGGIPISIPPGGSSISLLKHISKSTLGSAALSLHYANIIILIEKLASSPHLIALDARDDLYDMLTTSIRSMLRKRLKFHTRSNLGVNVTLTPHDAALATEWSIAIARILDWLSPLAHNTVRWHSERNYGKHNIAPHPWGNLILVQTLYFANQSKTEAAIVQLLMGLNYLYRFGKVLESSGAQGYDRPTIV